MLPAGRSHTAVSQDEPRNAADRLEMPRNASIVSAATPAALAPGVVRMATPRSCAASWSNESALVAARPTTTSRRSSATEAA
jgi:hypothetical protein